MVRINSSLCIFAVISLAAQIAQAQVSFNAPQLFSNSHSSWIIPHQDGTFILAQSARSDWMVIGSNALVGKLHAKAQFFTNHNTVSGVLDGYYENQEDGVIARVEVFNYYEGRIENDRYELQWRNPLDHSSGIMTLMQRGDQLVGQWRTSDGQSSGDISFRRIAQPLSPISLEDSLERKRKLERGNQLLRSAANKMDQQDYPAALKECENAATLFASVGDENKLGYALFCQGQVEMSRNNFASARQHFMGVRQLGPKVSERIRFANENVLETVNLLLEQGSKIPDHK